MNFKFHQHQTMKTKRVVLTSALWKAPLLVVAIAAMLSARSIVAQTPPAPVPPTQPGIPAPPDSPRDRRPKEPVTYLGIETSSVPRVLSEQLGLARGFGLVVDYVAPDGPAAAAGVKESDILKMLNDQILTEPDQLGKLVRSYPEGTNVTLTILRKGAETKVTVKLGKREVPARRGMRNFEKHFNFDDGDFGMLGGLEDLKDLGDAPREIMRDAVEQARREVEHAKDEVMRARDEAQRAMQEVHVSRTDDNGMIKTTRIDLRKAEIVYSDQKGEMKIDSVDGKKQLTAKDPQGRLLFSGPVETKEDRDKMPPELRERFEKFKEKDLPAAIPMPPPPPASDIDDDDDDETETDMREVNQVSLQRPFWTVGTIRI
jgi:serine protease Do